MRLHIGGLETNHRVSGGMRFVETVACELVDEFEDIGRFFAFDTFRNGAIHKSRLLRRHLGLVFLTHGAAEQIGLAKRITAHDLGNLNDLLLINDNAVGFLQDALEQVVEAIDRLFAVFAIDVGRDVVHRARPVKRDHGDDIFKAVGFQPLQAFAHAGRFQLEHTGGVGFG